MAKIGLKYPVYKGTSSGSIGKAIKADISIEMDKQELHADDAIAESYQAFKKGSVTLDTSNITKTEKNLLLGHTVVGNEITSNIADVYPYVGFGFYGAEQIDGVTSYRAVWFPKVQFSEPADNNATKGESLAFGTHSLPGTIYGDASGDWKKEESFALEADAITWLQTKASISTSVSANPSAFSMTGTGGTLSPAFAAATRNYTYGGLTGTAITMTYTAASQTIKLYEVINGVDTYIQDLTSGAASASISISSTGSHLYKIVSYEANKASVVTYVLVVKTA